MRFVVCGEALIDLVPERPTRDTRLSRWSGLSAGGPMNSAIALSRLGRNAEMLARLGSDAFADQLRSHLTANGVGLGLAVNADAATSLAVVSLGEGGQPSYTFHFAGTANFGWQVDELPHLGPDDWLHIASLAIVIDPGAGALLRWLEAEAPNAAGVSVDVNVRPSVIADPAEYWRRVEQWLTVVGRVGGLLKASDEDLEFLARAPHCPGETAEAVASAWVATYGAGAVALTRGPDGAVAYSADGRVESPGRTVSIVDTVGAGDTFMAGFLDAYVADPTQLEAALARGIAAASIVVGRQGANPPTAAEVDKVLAG